MELKCMTDYKIEQMLESEGLKAEIMTWRLADIDISASLRNHARFSDNPVIEEKVEDYANAMLRGDMFPCGVITTLKQPTPNGFILDGIQRYHAALRVKAETFSFYTIENTSDMVMLALPRMFNLLHGVGLTRDEKIQHGLEFRERLKWTNEEIARRLYLRPGDFALGIRIMEAKHALQKNRVDVSALSRTHLKNLVTIKNETVQTEAARLMASQQLHVSECNELLVLLRDAKKTEEAQLRVVYEFANKIKTAPRKQKGHKANRASIFMSKLRLLVMAIGDCTTLSQLHIVNHQEQRSVLQYLAQIEKFIETVRKEARQMKKEVE